MKRSSLQVAVALVGLALPPQTTAFFAPGSPHLRGARGAPPLQLQRGGFLAYHPIPPPLPPHPRGASTPGGGHGYGGGLPLADNQGGGLQQQLRRRGVRLPVFKRQQGQDMTALQQARGGGEEGEDTPAAIETPKPRGVVKVFGVDIRIIVLCLLVVQNACQMLSMRYTRVGAGALATPYLSSTAVVLSELLKVAACFAILAYTHRGKTFSMVYDQVLVNWQDTLKVSVPAFVYMLQNNLLYVATANLDAATCQITYQLKILTTALFTVTMLGRSISMQKWAALMVLVVGIALVQLPSIAAKTGAAAAGNPVLGLSAVVAACFMSGFAGIWFEKILKSSPTSVWVRNIQLGSMGAILGLIASLWKDGAAIQAGGFLQGYTPLVYSVVAQVGMGGLIVALVVKYADNILKGFATSLSIITSGILSFYFIPALKFSPTPTWFIGTSLVLAATFLYSLPDKPKPAPTSTDAK